MSEDRELISYSKNMLGVYFDPLNSHAATHFSDTPQLKELVKEIVGGLELDGELMEFDIDMGRIVGKSDGVLTDPGDEIVFAKRKNRDVYTPFNKTKLPQPCSRVSVSLLKQGDGSYELQSAWIGDYGSPPFPGDEYETPESKPYWSAHSLAFGRQEIQPGTEITECPW